MSTQTQGCDSLIYGGSRDDSVHKLNHLIDILEPVKYLFSSHVLISRQMSGITFL